MEDNGEYVGAAIGVCGFGPNDGRWVHDVVGDRATLGVCGLCGGVGGIEDED